jgi:hypothetical protein
MERHNMKAQYPLTITSVDNGFIVQAGCITVVKTPWELGAEIQRWIFDPRSVEKEYLATFRGPADPTVSDIDRMVLGSGAPSAPQAEVAYGIRPPGPSRA